MYDVFLKSNTLEKRQLKKINSCYIKSNIMHIDLVVHI